MFYEALKDLTDYGMKKWTLDADYQINTTLEGLVLGGVAGGIISCYFSILSCGWNIRYYIEVVRKLGSNQKEL